MMCPELSIRIKGLECSLAPEAHTAWPLTPPAESREGVQPLSTLISRFVVLLLQLRLEKKAGHTLRGEESTISTLCSKTRRGLIFANYELKTGLLLSLQSLRKQTCRHPHHFMFMCSPGSEFAQSTFKIDSVDKNKV